MTLLLPVRRSGPHYPDAGRTVSTGLFRSEGVNANYAGDQERAPEISDSVATSACPAMN